MDSHHSNNPDGIDCTSGDIANLLFVVPRKNKEYLLEVLKEVDQCDANAETTAAYIQAIKRNKLLKEISLCSYEVSEGRQDVSKLTKILEEYTKEPETTEDSTTDSMFEMDDLDTLITSAIHTQGLRWRLNTLNQMLGSIRKGDFGFIFARPETGKTTLLASEVTFMAEQLKEEDGPILWINNEEQSKKVRLRCYQAALGIDLTTLYSNISAHQTAFLEKTHNKILITQSGSYSRKDVEVLCRRYKPSLLIFDQIDKITGFDNDREDLKLGAIYQWARDIAKEYCPVIAVCQSDGSGEGVRWLTMSNVANAKTAKQAEADWILGIGKVPDPGYDNLRFLHLSKNKLMGDSDTDPAQRHGRREVLIEAQIARFKDIM